MKMLFFAAALLFSNAAIAQQAQQADLAQDLFSDIQGNAVAFKHVNESALAILKAYGALKAENERLKTENEKLKTDAAKTNSEKK